MIKEETIFFLGGFFSQLFVSLLTYGKINWSVAKFHERMLTIFLGIFFFFIFSVSFMFALLLQSLARVDREGEEDDEEESLYQATKF